MGRFSTGAITVNQCLQLQIKPLLKELKVNLDSANGTIKWTNGASISFIINKNITGFTLILDYKRTINGDAKPVQYKINIEPLTSNLGKGEIYFFLCPFTFKRCKTLYLGYESEYFKSLKAYKNRIYYPSQLSSYLDKHNDTYWRLEKRLETMQTKHIKSHYKGKVTNAGVIIQRLKLKQLYHDQMRWAVLPKSLQKSMGII